MGSKGNLFSSWIRLGFNLIYNLEAVATCLKNVMGLALVHFQKYWLLSRALNLSFKVENILKGSLISIPSPSPSVKIQIVGGKVCLRCKGKTLLGVVNKLLKTKSLLTLQSNVLPYYLKLTFPPIIWIFTEGEGIESRLSS